jgi:hypothetical protein
MEDKLWKNDFLLTILSHYSEEISVLIKIDEIDVCYDISK